MNKGVKTSFICFHSLYFSPYQNSQGFFALDFCLLLENGNLNHHSGLFFSLNSNCHQLPVCIILLHTFSLLTAILYSLLISNYPSKQTTAIKHFSWTSMLLRTVCKHCYFRIQKLQLLKSKREKKKKKDNQKLNTEVFCNFRFV